MGDQLEHKISIIANPQGNASKFASKVYEHVYKKVEDNCSQNPKEYVEWNPLDVLYFPDGEFLPRPSKNVRNRHCIFIHDSNLDPSVWSKQLIVVNQSLRKSWAEKITNIGLYWKWARQDKKKRSRDPITAQIDGKAIDYPNVRASTVEVHNETMEGFFDMPFSSYPFFVPLYNHLKNNSDIDLKNFTFGGVDKGSIERNGEYIKALGMNEANVDKRRTIEGKLGKSLGVLGVENVKGRDVLLFDDQWATGGSYSAAIKAFNNAGAKRIIGAIAHPLILEGFNNIADEVEMLYLGNTIQQPLIPGEGVLLPPYASQGFPKSMRENFPTDKPVFFSDVLRLQDPFKNFKLPSNVRIVELEESIGDSVYQLCVGGSVSSLYDLSKENDLTDKLEKLEEDS